MVHKQKRGVSHVKLTRVQRHYYKLRQHPSRHKKDKV